MSRDWLTLQCAYDGTALPPLATCFTVNGTGVPDPFGPGFAGDVGRGLDTELWYWQPIGYPAATFPMGPSVDAGVAELVRQINRYAGNIALAGYSQGAIVVGKVWRDHILNPGGDLHHRLPDVIGIVNFGDPMRCPGIANGNTYAGLALPRTLDGVTTGGISGPQDLTPDQTPPFLLSFANDGDLYASAPVGDNPWTAEAAVGADETLIYNIVQSITVADVIATAEKVAQIILQPLAQIIPLVEAILNGGMFFVVNRQGPHDSYSVGPAITFLNQAAQTAAAA